MADPRHQRYTSGLPKYRADEGAGSLRATDRRALPFNEKDSAVVMVKHFDPVAQRLQEARVELQDTPDAAAHVLSVREQIAAISRGDFEGALRQSHPDIELNIYAPPEFQWIRRARGVGELRKAIEHNFGSVDDQRPVITNVIAQGDVLVLIGTERGTIKATGAPYHVEFVHRFTFVDGALTSIRIIAARTS